MIFRQFFKNRKQRVATSISSPPAAKSILTSPSVTASSSPPSSSSPKQALTCPYRGYTKAGLNLERSIFASKGAFEGNTPTSTYSFSSNPYIKSISPDILKKSIPFHGEFEKFTEQYYRHNLKVLTGIDPCLIDKTYYIDAHHIFPQKFRAKFADIGINIDDPHYLVWWESNIHRPKAYDNNKIWKTFFDSKTCIPTKEGAFELATKLAETEGIKIEF